MGVDLGRHLVREQVEVSPGQLHVGQREHTYSSQTVNIGFNVFLDPIGSLVFSVLVSR